MSSAQGWLLVWFACLVVAVCWAVSAFRPHRPRRRPRLVRWLHDAPPPPQPPERLRYYWPHTASWIDSPPGRHTLGAVCPARYGVRPWMAGGTTWQWVVALIDRDDSWPPVARCITERQAQQIADALNRTEARQS